MKKPTPTKPTKSFPVIAYERFSDLQQAEGDSERRQKAGAVLWAEQFGGTLLELASPYEDHGKSGFKGNKQKALSRLEKDIESGKIEAGTTIYFEHIDRLGRRGITPTQELVAKFFRFGINIGIRLPTPKHYLAKEATNNLALAVEIAALAYTARVYSESLSDRISNVWEQQRKAATKDNRPIQSKPPGWIDKVTEGEKVVYKLNDHADTVRFIFQRIKQVGTTIISQELNADPNRPAWGYSKKWGRSHISQLIKDRAVLGEYQPHVMDGQKRKPHGEPILLYPPVPGITEEDWLVANAAATNRKKERGPSKLHVNILAGLIHSLNDGSSIRIHTSHTLGKGKPTRRLKSANATEGVDGACSHTIELVPFEAALLKFLRELDPNDLITTNQKSDLATINGKIGSLNEKIERLDRRIAEHPEDIDRIMPAIRTLEAERDTLTAERQKIASNSFADQKRSIEDVKKEANIADVEFRYRLRDALKTVCERIDVLTDKAGPHRNSPIAALIAITLRTGWVRSIILWKKESFYYDRSRAIREIQDDFARAGSLAAYADHQAGKTEFNAEISSSYGELEDVFDGKRPKGSRSRIGEKSRRKIDS